MFKTIKLLAVLLCAGSFVLCAAPKAAHRGPGRQENKMVTYRPKRGVYTIQLNKRNQILFEQRQVGMKELRAKIKMVSYDVPRPLIVLRAAAGVEESRIQQTVKLLKNAGFKDIKIERAKNFRGKVVPRKAAPRLKR